ncbi:hypothetical protein [Acholeplasma equifetale]|uniref:hypothetical protein n=1 Tax=Acholeplasma equifetale TaxID=264634 RepID=UPI00047A9E3A|nr:hypothetical protein [Acholeplasma equifetale]
MKLNIVDYTKNVMTELEKENLYLTHLFITYKVILYYENNVGPLNTQKNDLIEKIVHEIYDEYLLNNENDLIDEIIEMKFRKL